MRDRITNFLLQHGPQKHCFVKHLRAKQTYSHSNIYIYTSPPQKNRIEDYNKYCIEVANTVASCILGTKGAQLNKDTCFYVAPQKKTEPPLLVIPSTLIPELKRLMQIEVAIVEDMINEGAGSMASSPVLPAAPSNLERLLAMKPEVFEPFKHFDSVHNPPDVQERIKMWAAQDGSAPVCFLKPALAASIAGNVALSPVAKLVLDDSTFASPAPTPTALAPATAADKTFDVALTDDPEDESVVSSTDSSIISNMGSIADTSVMSNDESAGPVLKSCIKKQDKVKQHGNIHFADKDELFELQENFDDLRTHLTTFNETLLFNTEKAHAVEALADAVSTLIATQNAQEVRFAVEFERIEHKIRLLENGAAVQGSMLLRLSQESDV